MDYASIRSWEFLHESGTIEKLVRNYSKMGVAPRAAWSAIIFCSCKLNIFVILLHYEMDDNILQRKSSGVGLIKCRLAFEQPTQNSLSC